MIENLDYFGAHLLAFHVAGEMWALWLQIRKIIIKFSKPPSIFSPPATA